MKTRINPFAEAWRQKNKKVQESYAKKQALSSRKVGKGKSHITGNVYEH